MPNGIIAGLCNGQILQSNQLATVTRECIVIRDAARQSHTIIALSQLTGVKRIRTTYPALLVISSGLFLISAAAFCSKQGSGTGVPTAVLGAAFAVSYILSRRASVAFIVGSEATETMSGSLADAAALIAAVQAAQNDIQQKA
jgi:hypothetical protein